MREQAPPTISLGDNELARRLGARIECRTTPCRLRWDVGPVVTTDRHELSCTFEGGARIADNPTDRQTAEQVLLTNRAAVTAADIEQRLRGSINSAVAEFVAGRDVQDVLTSTGRAAMLEAIQGSASAAAFACGIELLGPQRLDVHSGSFTRQQLEAVEHARREERAAHRLENLKRAGKLLKEFEAMRAVAPVASASTVLERMRPEDRGEVLESLLYASAERTAVASTLWAVSGNDLVHIDPRPTPPAIQKSALPESLGPLRSVRSIHRDGKIMLLVGARSGVWLVDPSVPEQAVAYHDDELQTEQGMGFNDAVLWRDEIWATHGTLGVVGWSIDNPAAPRVAIPPTRLPIGAGAARVGGPRNPCPVENQRLLFSAHNTLLTITADAEPKSIAALDSPIILIAPSPPDYLVLTSDCSLLRLDGQSLRPRDEQRRFSAASAATTMPWLGGEQWIVLATAAGSVQCVGTDDSVVIEYAGGKRHFRMVAAAADLVAAVTEDRQRIVFWNSWDGRQPVAEVYITGLTHHRIADLQFV